MKQTLEYYKLVLNIMWPKLWRHQLLCLQPQCG